MSNNFKQDYFLVVSKNVSVIKPNP